MRKIVSSLFISLDGVVEAPDTWHFPYFNEEMGAEVGRGFEESDAFLLGRRTYEEFARYWPNEGRDEPNIGEVMNGRPKYVVSGSLEKADWENSSVVRVESEGRLAKEMTLLKQQPGRDIDIIGSGTLVRGLLTAGLLDELRLLVHPLVVGGEKARLFPAGCASVPLRLAESRTFQTGVLALTYTKG